MPHALTKGYTPETFSLPLMDSPEPYGYGLLVSFKVETFFKPNVDRGGHWNGRCREFLIFLN